jgi:integrase
LRSHKRLLAAANVDYKKFHAYRHTFATNLFLQKKEILYISKVLGHSSIRETEKTYIHLLDEQIRREILGEDYEKVTFYEAT